MRKGTNEGNYLIEIDGISAVRAMNVSGGAMNMTPTLTSEGNRRNPHVGGGNFEVDEVTVKQATALNDTGSEFFSWLNDYARGYTTERRTLRIVELDEDGATPVQTWEYIGCVPTSISPDDRSARGTNSASFTFKLKPEDFRLL